jgi:hypothetical protein
LKAIRQSYIERGLLSAEEWPDFLENQSPSNRMLELIEALDTVQDERVTEVAFSVFKEFMDETAFIYSYRNRSQASGTDGQTRMQLVLDFPNLYVDQLDQILWPNWYTACFSETFSNSSMWGNYANGHRGVCLIFETGDTGNGSTINLHQIAGFSGDGHGHAEDIWRFSPMEFLDVHYERIPGEVDFFKSIGKIPRPALLDLWYTDEGGHLSDCASHLDPEANEDVWRKEYWNTFHRDTAFKTKDWEYELERRLVLYPLLREELDDAARILTYNFSSLKGIIFGIETSIADKHSIIEIIQRKCTEQQRSDFKFYQAYYSPEHGDIRRR